MASPATRNWTRNRADDCHIEDDVRVTTGPGRYILEAPNSYCNASFVPEPTTRQQKWGASQVQTYTKTDVESDLWNINRTTTKAVCGQYDPNDNRMNTADKKNIKEASFPQTHTRLNDPPCTLRGTGWNRWQWLCQNPQEGVMVPFDWFIPGRILHKDAHRPCIPSPLNPNPVLPPAGIRLTHKAVDVPGAYGSSVTDATNLSVMELPARVLPEESFADASPLQNTQNDKAPYMLMDTRQVAWPEAPSINGVPFPVPTGPPSVAWQRGDIARGVYNTNVVPTTSDTGRVLPGPALKTMS